MNSLFRLLAIPLLVAGPVLAATCFTVTEEHVDLLSVHWDADAGQLQLLASDDDHGRSYASNECVVLCPESLK